MNNGYMDDPSGIFKASSQGQGSPLTPRKASSGSGSDSGDSQSLLIKLTDFLTKAFKKGVSTVPPRHLFIPEDAQSLDLKNLFDVAAGATVDIIDFVAPQGALTVIQYYGIFNDGLLAANYDFIPTVDGRRAYVYHGDPLDNFRIYLGVAPDLSNNSLIVGTLYLQPGQRLKWTAVNRSAVTTSMGVRVVGFVDRSQTRTQTRSQG